MTGSEYEEFNGTYEVACVSCSGWLDSLKTAKKYCAVLCCADLSTGKQYLQGRRRDRAMAGEYFSDKSTSGLKPYNRTVFTPPFPIRLIHVPCQC
jgi:heterodisulfide reductase subunit A-like polyferredoxin